jgi:hypothetical protein
MTNENEAMKFEVLESSALEQMERAQIDVQISTAKKYPRQLSAVKARMLSFATLDTETAAGCFFTLPGRKGGDGKPIQGPSIRMAEIAISTYQNLRAGARVIADDGKVITSQGVCHDLENNVCVSVEVKRRVTTREGKRYSDDMVVMTGNAACSIALRNATFRVVPLALVKPIYEAAKRVAVGDAKTLVTRRADAMAHFTKMGVTKEKVLAVVGAKTTEDIGLEQLEVLIGYANAIKDGDTSIDEVFNPPASEKPDAASLFTKKAAETPDADQIPGAEVPTTKPAEEPKKKTAVNYVKGTRNLLALAQITEAELLDFMRVHGLDDSLITLEEVSQIAPGKLAAVYDDWQNVVAEINRMKSK